MNKSLKTILITSIAILGAGFLFVQSTEAVEPPLVVQFETTPLFDEANFLPDDAVSRWVKVTNNSGQTQRIATEAINKSDPNRLGDVLNLEIKEGGITRYNDSLSKFFAVGEVFLSNLAGNGVQTQYDFIVTFYSGTQNQFQDKSLSFDILIGFQGTEGGILPGAGGGTGGYLPPGLTIQDESVRITTTTEISITLIWTTSYLSTSQVIYSRWDEPHILNLTDNAGTPPKYGYAHTTSEYDISPKVTAHSITIYGLTPGTTYYYRAVSHGSLAISVEHSFTTLTETTEKGAEEGTEVKGEEIVEEFVQEGPSQVSEEGRESGGGKIVEKEGGEEIVEEETGPNMFLASIGNFFNQGNLWWILILAIVIIIVLFLLSKKKKQKTNS